MSSEPREMLLENLRLIEQIVFVVGRRNGMPREAIEEFSSELKLRLVEDNFAVIRAYRGQSSFATYMAAVVSRALLDHRNREWGKWYASAAATKLGAAAVDLERLMHRDGRTLEEASELLLQQDPELTRAELEALAAKLPPRLRRKHVDLDDVALRLQVPAAPPADQESTALRVSDTIREFVGGLPSQDRHVLHLRFYAGQSVSQIARMLDLDPQLVYRQLYRLFREMRIRLEAAGIRAADVEEIVGSDDAFLDFRLQHPSVRPGDVTALEEVRS